MEQQQRKHHERPIILNVTTAPDFIKLGQEISIEKFLANALASYNTSMSQNSNVPYYLSFVNKEKISNIQLQENSNITYPDSYNDTEHPLNPFLSIAPDAIPLVVERTMNLFYHQRMIRNRHECIRHIRDKHQELLGPLLEPILKVQQRRKQQQQQQKSVAQNTEEDEVRETTFNVLLVDPAYHTNVGDHMLSLGEIQLIKSLQEQQGYTQVPVEQCSYNQAG
jgi:hypothetical protein